jgi:branched-chain amino acid aminotransferase
MSERPQPANYFAAGAAFIDGEYVPIGEARIPILDRGFTRSDATYDVTHVWKGWIFRLDDYLDRFERNMAALRMRIPYSRAELRDILLHCVRLSGLRDAYVQMTCTRGVPPAGSRDPRDCTNQLYAFAIPFVWIASDEQQKTGLNLHISAIRRIPPQSIDPRTKNFHWLDLTMGLLEAYDEAAISTCSAMIAATSPKAPDSTSLPSGRAGSSPRRKACSTA